MDHKRKSSPQTQARCRTRSAEAKRQQEENHEKRSRSLFKRRKMIGPNDIIVNAKNPHKIKIEEEVDIKPDVNVSQKPEMGSGQQDLVIKEEEVDIKPDVDVSQKPEMGRGQQDLVIKEEEIAPSGSLDAVPEVVIETNEAVDLPVCHNENYPRFKETELKTRVTPIVNECVGCVEAKKLIEDQKMQIQGKDAQIWELEMKIKKQDLLFEKLEDVLARRKALHGELSASREESDNIEESQIEANGNIGNQCRSVIQLDSNSKCTESGTSSAVKSTSMNGRFNRVVETCKCCYSLKIKDKASSKSEDNDSSESEDKASSESEDNDSSESEDKASSESEDRNSSESEDCEMEVKAKNGNNEIFEATLAGVGLEELERLVRQGASWNTTYKGGDTILHVAAKAGNLKALRYFISIGGDVNARNFHFRRTPMHETVHTNQNFLSAVDILLAHGADLNQVDSLNQNLIFIATSLGRPVEQLEALVKKGCDWRKKTNGGDTILHAAAYAGNLEAVRLFISLGAVVDAKRGNGTTPLIEAMNAKVNFCAMVDLLLSYGADINVTPWGHFNLISYARQCGRSFDEIKMLIDRGVNPTRKNLSCILMDVIEKGDLEAIRYVIEKGADVNFRRANYPNLETSFSLCFRKIKNVSVVMSIVNLLLENRANINSRDGEGNNIMFSATEHGITSNELAKLIDRGASWKTTNSKGGSILHIAVNYGNEDALNYFISKGADINAKNKDGSTPLMEAAMSSLKNSSVMVQSLLENNADVNIVTEHEDNVLFKLIKSMSCKDDDDDGSEKADDDGSEKADDDGSEKADDDGSEKADDDEREKADDFMRKIKLLIEHGASWNTRKSNGDTILHEVAKSRVADVCKYFVSLGADVNARNAVGDTPFMCAVKTDKETICEEGIEFPPRRYTGIPRPTDYQAREYFRAQKDVLKILQELLECGADVKADVLAADYHNTAPVSIEIKIPCFQVVKQLLDLGCR